MNFFQQRFDALTAEEKEMFLAQTMLNMEGETGDRIRAEYWSERVGHWGRDCSMGRNVIVLQPENLFMEDGSRISHNCYVRAGHAHGIRLGKGANVKENCILDVERPDQGFIHIGDHSYIGAGSILYGHVGLTIGSQCLLAQRITITPFQHTFSDSDRPIADQGGDAAPVVIDDDCYVGQCATFLLGVGVGRGSVVGAASLVRKDIAPYSVVAGVPARLIRMRK